MFTKNGLKAILLQFIGKTGSSIIRSAYLGLSANGLTSEGNFVEPVGGNYSRVLLGDYSYSNTQKLSSPIYDESAQEATVSNVSEIHFNETTGNWGTLRYFGIFSSQTGGEPLYVGELRTEITPTANTVVIIRVGDLKISIK